jgi:putative NIF3 family GTP cyclohydrolase 1 type 2
VLANLLAYLDELLEPAAFHDYGPNGLQVPGPERVETVVTGVSASAELFRRAADLGADLVLVHHGIFWSGAPLALSGPSGACSCSSSTTWRSPRTTCRSTVTPRSATTR